MSEKIKSVAEFQSYVIDADERLEKICRKKLTELYGTKIEKSIYDLLSWELERIREKKSASIILLTKELIDQSGLTPYEIGYEGTIGALLVGYLCGITCVNPLETKLPMYPEAFLGVYGDSLIDIDIDVPSSLQKEIMESCSELEGIGEVFHVGAYKNITPQDCYKIIEKYEMEHKVDFLPEKGTWIADKISQLGVQNAFMHPSGMLLVPKGHDILELLSLINGVDDEHNLRLTYWGYIENFYTMDILSRKATDFIYSLMKKTGVNVADISLEDEAVIHLFQSNIILENCRLKRLGPLGVPEFQSECILGMLELIQPKDFTDIVAVIALLYGGGTWEKNAKVLLEKGIATKNDIITTIEDVYESLIALGFDREDALKITKMVRQGKAGQKMWSPYREEILKVGAADWFVYSLEKIEWLVSRAYAYRCALNSWWGAWFKIYYPKEFYEVYFELCYKKSLVHAMKQGEDCFNSYLFEQRREIDIKEWDVDIEVAREMFGRDISLK